MNPETTSNTKSRLQAVSFPEHMELASSELCTKHSKTREAIINDILETSKSRMGFITHYCTLHQLGNSLLFDLCEKFIAITSKLSPSTSEYIQRQWETSQVSGTLALDAFDEPGLINEISAESATDFLRLLKTFGENLEEFTKLATQLNTYKTSLPGIHEVIQKLVTTLGEKISGSCNSVISAFHSSTMANYEAEPQALYNSLDSRILFIPQLALLHHLLSDMDFLYRNSEAILITCTNYENELSHVFKKQKQIDLKEAYEGNSPISKRYNSYPNIRIATEKTWDDFENLRHTTNRFTSLEKLAIDLVVNFENCNTAKAEQASILIAQQLGQNRSLTGFLKDLSEPHQALHFIADDTWYNLAEWVRELYASKTLPYFHHQEPRIIMPELEKRKSLGSSLRCYNLPPGQIAHLSLDVFSRQMPFLEIWQLLSICHIKIGHYLPELLHAENPTQERAYRLVSSESVKLERINKLGQAIPVNGKFIVISTA
jgi:hypothetical protein